MSCWQCFELKKLQGKTTPCDTCDRPSLLSENILVYSLIQQYSSLLVNEGNINPDGIRLMFELEKIPEDEQSLLAEKIMVYISTAVNKSRDGQPESKHN